MLLVRTQGTNPSFIPIINEGGIFFTHFKGLWMEVGDFTFVTLYCC